jgi:hypothetical protein
MNRTKYCPECGAKLGCKRATILTAAGILTIIAASLCIFIGIIGVVTYSEDKVVYREWLKEDYLQEAKEYPICGTPYPITYYHYAPPPQYLIVGIFGFLSFLFGLTSGILILLRKLFCLTIIGLALIMGTAVMLIMLDIIFIPLGLPILVMGVISTVFTCISKKDFVS